MNAADKELLGMLQYQLKGAQIHKHAELEAVLKIAIERIQTAAEALEYAQLRISEGCPSDANEAISEALAEYRPAHLTK